MNKKHVSKVGRRIGMVCLLFVCAMVQSCRDEYFFDDTEPSFVGSSIYDYLDEQGNFTCFLRVINDLGYKDVLQRTGSKTLFVADDNAFMDGIYKEWGVKEYERLTAAQKRLILYGAMLDNAYLLEMLSKMQSTGANAEPIPGQCLRRVTSASVTDTIGLFSPVDLPRNNDAWKGEEFNSVRLALDASQTMMTHFIEDQLYMKNINEHDLQLLVSNPTARLADIYIYDKKVIKEKSDVTCKNGYVHQLEGLLIPPSNMAEEIRENGNMEDVETFSVTSVSSDDMAFTTQIFSRLLDRFAVPVPIAEGSEVAQNYRRMYGVTDKLFEKKYYTESFSSYEYNGLHSALGTLLFDPGWNEYRAGSTDKEQDMAAIFAPSDKAFVEYFTGPGGSTLLDRYAKGITNLVEAIDSIPVDIIQPLVRNHMQMSFSSTVPSKFEYIVDDARDPMKVLEKDVKKVMLANNGVVYVMDTVYSPARYNSVIAPVMLIDTLSAFNKAIKDLRYDIYLLSMGNKFSLIVTSDSGLVYYDPYTERKNVARDYIEKNLKGYKFKGVIENDKLVMTAKEIAYDRNLYDAAANSFAELKDPKPKDIAANDVNGYFQRIFKEILEYNIIIGDMNSDKDRSDGRQYYMSKGYGAVKVERDDDGSVKAIAGGRELQNGTSVTVVKANQYQKTNGHTFQIDGSIIQPPTQTVRDVLGHEKFKNFSDLCTPSDRVLTYLFGEETSANKEKWNKYRIFAGQQGDEQYNLVRFFDTYHYTVYVPSNGAMTTAHTEGLPTWGDLEKEIDDFEKAYKPSEDSDGSVKEDFVKSLTAGADLIVKFVRYHFQDNSVFVDKVPHALEVDEGNGNRRYEYKVNYETSAFNEVRNKFCSVLVQSDAEPEDYDPMVNTIAVRGDFGEEDEMPLDKCVNVCRVIKEDENTLYNVMAREAQYNGSTIKTSSYAVVHQIDNFLVYGGEGGIYNPDAASTSEKFIR